MKALVEVVEVPMTTAREVVIEAAVEATTWRSVALVLRIHGDTGPMFGTRAVLAKLRVTL